jgi:hypothetical protein
MSLRPHCAVASQGLNTAWKKWPNAVLTRSGAVDQQGTNVFQGQVAGSCCHTPRTQEIGRVQGLSGSTGSRRADSNRGPLHTSDDDMREKPCKLRFIAFAGGRRTERRHEPRRAGRGHADARTPGQLRRRHTRGRVAATDDQRPRDPANSTDLEALVVSPTGFEGQVVYSVIAEIEVRSVVDRWLTAIFKPADGQPLRSSELFPPRA